MSEREIIEQLESLIEAWQLDEADLNQTDINAIKGMLDKNKKLKKQLENERKARKEAIKYLYEHSQYVDEYGIHYIKEDEYCVDYLLDILNIDKGE